MLKYLGMMLLSIVVIGAITPVMLWFFRRLNRIEDEKWGRKLRPESLPPPATRRKTLPEAEKAPPAEGA